jgi:hypothetical protein
MCDYSLHHVATRPARVEDKLVTTRFNNSVTRGFAAVGGPNVAVCLLPGTELVSNASGSVEFSRARKLDSGLHASGRSTRTSLRSITML